uniref:Vacuolar protein sorting 54 homolog (S. cerevisiae) [Strongylocentrotus purpuratus] n=1 Tax=Lepeophtheirus salmonis TaxID=72036 RepID=A0A0K2TC74_LEPSM
MIRRKVFTDGLYPLSFNLIEIQIISGKQKDFFTRSWGDSFVDTAPIPSSPYLYQLSEHAFTRYIRRVRKHLRPNARAKTPSLLNGTQASTPKKVIPPLSGIPKFFLDENFDLMKPEVFSYIFPFLMKSSKGNQNGMELSGFSSQSREVQECVTQHLDVVEINLGHHLAQKYHHFFQVMSYQDALMSQLKVLIKVVKELREDLRELYEPMNLSLKVSQLLRRKNNYERIQNRLNSMSFLHQTQPTIQLLLSNSEFSGALDLIRTSKDILRVELKGVVSFRHLFSQLDEIQVMISKILVSDFRGIIVTEVEKHTFLKRATCLDDLNEDNEDLNEGKLFSVIYGLLRLNSYTFLEELEESCANAVKNIIAKCVSVLPHSKDQASTTSYRVGEFARIATPEGWTDLFDMLLGSLIVLLRRVKLVQRIILTAIIKVNDLTDSSPISLRCENNYTCQTQSLEDSSSQVLMNVCDLINERCATLLALRSKSEAISLMTLNEPKTIEKLIFILNNEMKTLSFGNSGNCLYLTLLSQFLQFIQCFDERQREKITQIVTKEKWVKSVFDICELVDKCSQFPRFVSFFKTENTSNGHCISYKDEELSYDILESALAFLYIVIDYHMLSIELPGVKRELGFKLVDILCFYNSRICQYIIGLAALKFMTLPKISFINLYLTFNSIDFISRFIPILASEFEDTSNEHKKISESLSRQFDNAMNRYSDHKQEIVEKIIETLDDMQSKEFSAWTWDSKKSVPSQNFKKICRNINTFHETANSFLPKCILIQIMKKVHINFCRVVRNEIKRKQRKSPKVDRISRDLLSEMVYYGQSLLRITDIIPQHEASNDYFEKNLWD